MMPVSYYMTNWRSWVTIIFMSKRCKKCLRYLCRSALMNVIIYPDTDTLSHEAAQYVVRIAQESIVTHGRFTFAFSGGSTPRKLYSLLGSEPYRSQIDWALVELFWSDERSVPPEDEESNYHMAKQVLLSKVPIPAEQVHRMPAD